MKHSALVVLGIFTTLALGSSGAASAHDELYHSAADCKPVTAGHFNGSGAQGFSWFNGAWYNFDENETQILVCDIPYRRSTSNLETIVVRAVVHDAHPADFTSVFLCGRNSGVGTTTCVSDTDFPSVFGISTIELQLNPTSSTRFVWIEVRVPEDADDNNPFSFNDTSGFIGYRVFRK